MIKDSRFGGLSIRFVALLAAMAALVILPLGAAAKGTDGGPSGLLMTNVTSSWNSAPLAGAAVQVWDEYGNQAAAGVTGPDGSYQILLPVGSYKIVAQNKGYTDNEADGTVVIAGTSMVNIALAWNGVNPPPFSSPSCCAAAPRSAGVRKH